eukprot:EG_transcript_31065
MPLPPPAPARLTQPDGPPASPPGRGSPAETNPPPQVVSHPPPPVAAAAAVAWIPSSPQGPWGKPYSSALYDGAGIVTLAAPEAEAAAGTSAAELLRQQRQRREQEMWLLSPSKQKAQSPMGSAGQTLPISDTSSEGGTDRHPRKQLQMEPGPAAASTHLAAQPPVGGPSLPAVAAATAAGVTAPGAAAPSPPGWPGA